MSAASKARWANKELWPLGHVAIGLALLAGVVLLLTDWWWWGEIMAASFFVLAAMNLHTMWRRSKLPPPPWTATHR